LLGTRRHSPYFRHDKVNPLALDVLIVDEVSMVDLALMVKLLEAMPLSGRIILLGDKDQLSSVESGRVLADICERLDNCFSDAFAQKLAVARAVPAGSLAVDATAAHVQDCLVCLEKSYRFGAQSSIGRLAQAVLMGWVSEARQCLVDENAIVEGENVNGSGGLLAAKITAGYADYLRQSQPAKALELLKGFRLLCAHRHGAFGVIQVNQWVESVLLHENKIAKQGEWYAGRPVMITGNHYSMELYNGDIGLALHDEQGRLRVWFETGNGQVRSLSPSRIPAHETAYALTVHKSQGSEFDHVVLLLPEQPSPLITRELLYTAITRAKNSFELWGKMAVFAEGVSAVTQRSTGLSGKIFGVVGDHH
jgi:exodeoxyribonuclease V alpha subunit